MTNLKSKATPNSVENSGKKSNLSGATESLLTSSINVLAYRRRKVSNYLYLQFHIVSPSAGIAVGFLLVDYNNYVTDHIRHDAW